MQLKELQEEAWKLELYAELEGLKRQLGALQGLEADLDAAEAILDATEPGSSPAKALQPPQRRSGAEASAGTGEYAATAAGDSTGVLDDDGGEEYNVEEITEMQAKLDEELAEMFAQLKVSLREGPFKFDVHARPFTISFSRLSARRLRPHLPERSSWRPSSRRSWRSRRPMPSRPFQTGLLMALSRFPLPIRPWGITQSHVY